MKINISNFRLAAQREDTSAVAEGTMSPKQFQSNHGFLPKFAHGRTTRRARTPKQMIVE